TKQTSWSRSMDEEQATAVRHSEKTKQRGQQKFRTVRLQTGVQNKADSGHRRTAKRIRRTARKRFPKELRTWICVHTNPPFMINNRNILKK
ncbi:MAG: hypothetical protein ACI4TG_01145, partial [Ruminococcus sp.]